jgi:hypothetical protein
VQHLLPIPPPALITLIMKIAIFTKISYLFSKHKHVWFEPPGCPLRVASSSKNLRVVLAVLSCNSTRWLGLQQTDGLDWILDETMVKHWEWERRESCWGLNNEFIIYVNVVVSRLCLAFITDSKTVWNVMSGYDK